ncbi:protein crumbs homolog 2a isoform X2 [Denticeps clupeoides]|uniref:Protein crumbs homolog 2-like n=1 Tax=Denticeps clupeoides TaxID=299321 RepID=A0AAY4EK17_9TELE|nr:protein crumbs homolog 2-like isoform X2 [Denticeps clupeoides]
MSLWVAMEPGSALPKFPKSLFIIIMMFKWGILCTATLDDKCMSAPCQNGGTCVISMDDYACLCPRHEEVQYTGKDCDQLFDACAFAPCAECESTPGSREYTCICPAGYTGANCTEDVNECQSNPCHRGKCVDEVNGYSCLCPNGYKGQDCSLRVVDCVDEPCLNNGTCSQLPDGYKCLCVQGFDGDHCENDVDECLSHPCQNGAICLDAVGEYHCFCVPGFQGYNCEIDINECASRPCENNGTCINEKDRYSCECLLGFMGINCEVEINECELNPCQNGATCHDLIGLYICECVIGFEGLNCEININECASEPCQNGALCNDLVNRYECDCGGTGFTGDHCEVDIPECASDPCQHESTCVEGTNHYTCLCWPGYDGQNCEVDMDECADAPCLNGGQCFQNSDPANWEEGWEFSYAHAAGYVCHCQPGYMGENCSVNIDECGSGPCQNGATCKDLVNAYVCVCPAGFTGESCEVNIDECESQPCHNGAWCEDGVADYTCHCPTPENGSLPWGGHDCSVQLAGCVEHECQNGAICEPWLEGEEHHHTCICQPGFYDEVCSTPTTFSFSRPGFILVEVPLPERRRRQTSSSNHTASIQLRFRTTLTDMVLFYRGDAKNYMSLEINRGGLKAKATYEGSLLEVVFSSLVSDGGWHQTALTLGQGLVMVVKGPGCDSNGCRIEDKGVPNGPHFHFPSSFKHVYIGGAPLQYLAHLNTENGFMGCMEDLFIDSNPILHQNLPAEATQTTELGCSKTEWCKEDPCSQHGHCVDLWTSYVCECHRPYYGNACGQEFPSWTFSHEDTQSYVSYYVNNNHGASFNVSFFLRSLKPEGLLFQLRRKGSEGEEESYFSIFLQTGRLMVSSLPGTSPLTAPIFLTTGEKQLVQVELQHGQVFFKHAGLYYILGKVHEVEILEGDLAYVGGLPGERDSEIWRGDFKGCLQDLRLDDVHMDLDAWNSSVYSMVYFPNNAENVEQGCISDNTCKVKPCLNGGECTVTWNDFVCSCQPNFTGKHCETRLWCVSNPCINGGHCVDLPDGYECISNATFENSPLQYSAQASLLAPVTNIGMELRTRTENGILLRASNGLELLLVGLLDSSLRVEIHSDNSLEPIAFSGKHRLSDGSWHRVQISMAHPDHEASHWVITVDGLSDGSSAPDVAGRLQFLNEEGMVVALADSYTGCLGAVRLGGVYLPFVDDASPPQPGQFFRLGDANVQTGCMGAPVCETNPCQHGGVCLDRFNLFSCDCASGWEGSHCDVDINECVLHPCAHGRCTNQAGGFQCTCLPGYGGSTCEEDLNECLDGVCENGGTCVDGINRYTCVCPPEYSGPRCQWNYPPQLCGQDVQCANNGVCHDEIWGANCTCVPGFSGDRCEVEVDECMSNPCLNGGSCVDRLNRFRCVCAAGFSGPFCETSKLPQKERIPWLVVAIPLVCCGVLLLIIGLSFMVLTARRKRQSEGAYSPSQEEVAGARLEMDSMLKVPPEERLI